MPRVIKWSVVMNVAMTIALCGVYITVLGDLDTVLSTPIGVPFIQVLYDVTRSKAGTNVMASIVVVEMISACISEGESLSIEILPYGRLQC